MDKSIQQIYVISFFLFLLLFLLVWFSVENSSQERPCYDRRLCWRLHLDGFPGSPPLLPYLFCICFTLFDGTRRYRIVEWVLLSFTSLWRWVLVFSPFGMIWGHSCVPPWTETTPYQLCTLLNNQANSCNFVCEYLTLLVCLRRVSCVVFCVCVGTGMSLTWPDGILCMCWSRNTTSMAGGARPTEWPTRCSVVVGFAKFMSRNKDWATETYLKN